MDFRFAWCVGLLNEPNKSVETPKPIKRKEKAARPQLIACEIQMNTVQMPTALRQRNIQLQAIESTRESRSHGKMLMPEMITPVENELRHRRKAVVVEDVAQTSSAGNTTSDDDSGPDEGGVFQTYLVIEFSPEIRKKTLHWIIDKIRMKQARGGAGLLLRREPQTK